MKIFSPKDISQIVHSTIEHDDVSINDLVNRVGAKVAAEVMAMCKPGSNIMVFAGWTTNGAYAMATSRILLENGYNPTIHLFNIGGNRLSAETANQKKFLLNDFPDCDFDEIIKNFDTPVLNSNYVVVDGLFGTELDRALPKAFGLLIRSINESGARTISIEIPSGLFSVWNTNNSPLRDIIHANTTIAIESPCLSFFMNENIPVVGRIRTIDIGLNREAIRKAPYTYYLLTYHDIHRILRHRRPETSKANYGTAMICAGSYGMMGAAVLATRACLRAGVGKVVAYSPSCGYQIMQTAVPCAMFASDPDDRVISRITLDRNYDAVAIGPGIGTDNETIDALENFLKMAAAKQLPVVIDADALNCIAERPMMMNYVPPLSVLTPHAGEFDRIFGAQPSTEARLRKAIEIAAYHNIIIILKGHYTAIVRPDGKVHINSSGTPAMATPGSGDVLTGVIAALIAQKYTPETASIIGVYVHGVAGEMAEEEHGSYGVTAADIADHIGKAIKLIMDKN